MNNYIQFNEDDLLYWNFWNKLISLAGKQKYPDSNVIKKFSQEFCKKFNVSDNTVILFQYIIEHFFTYARNTGDAKFINNIDEFIKFSTKTTLEGFVIMIGSHPNFDKSIIYEDFQKTVDEIHMIGYKLHYSVIRSKICIPADGFIKVDGVNARIDFDSFPVNVVFEKQCFDAEFENNEWKKSLFDFNSDLFELFTDKFDNKIYAKCLKKNCFVSNKLLNNNTDDFLKNGFNFKYMYKKIPDNRQNSGWYFVESLDDTDFTKVSLNKVAALNKKIIKFLDLPAPICIDAEKLKILDNDSYRCLAFYMQDPNTAFEHIKVAHIYKKKNLIYCKCEKCGGYFVIKTYENPEKISFHFIDNINKRLNLNEKYLNSFKKITYWHNI